MSSSSSIALLPKPLPSDKLAVGQFLTKPLDPEAASFYSESTAEQIEDICDCSIHTRHRDLFSLDSSGRFAQSYGAKFDLSRVWRTPHLVSVTADQLIYRSLTSVSEGFETVCEDPEVREWIVQEGLAEKEQEFYFLVGMKELQNARFKRAVLSDGGASDRLLEVPIGKSTSRPSRESQQGDSRGMGEALNGVFGLDVRRVKARLNNMEEPHKTEDVGSIWEYYDVGKSPSSKQLMIGLGPPVPAEELRNMLDLSEDDVAINLEAISALSTHSLSGSQSPMLRAHSPAFRGRSPSPHPAKMDHLRI